MRRLKKATAVILVLAMMFSTVVGGNVVNASSTEEESTSPVANAVFEPLEIIEHDEGFYQYKGTENEYFYYNYWQNRISYTLTMKDGSVISGTGAGFEYNGEWHFFEHSDNQHKEPWTVGNTYSVTIDALGFTGEAAVTVVESPIESIDFEPVSIIEKSQGYYANQGREDEFYRYYWNNSLTYTITLTDGQIITGEYGQGFNYNGQTYSFQTTDDQWDNHWTVNNTYTPTVCVMGYETEVQVSIVESPVQSIEVQPISIMEKSNGYYRNLGSEDEFYYYSWYNKIDFKITMKDGQVIAGENATGFQYNNEWKNLSWTDNQWSEHWELGNTYTVIVSALGCETTVDISIVDTPVQSVTIDPITIMEKTNGYYASTETQEEYYYYNWNNAIRNYTITMKDGTVYTSTTGDGIQYDGEWYYFEQEDDQQINHWTVNRTYTPTVSFMGYKT